MSLHDRLNAIVNSILNKGSIISINQAEELRILLKDLDKIINDDSYHNVKRQIGYIIFDTIVESCATENCPAIDSESYDCLTDVSVAGYLMSFEQSVSEHKQLKIDKIIACKKECPNLNSDIFMKDLHDLNDEQISLCAKNRKAFWKYLKRQRFIDNNLSQKDYIEACLYIENHFSILKKVQQTKTFNAQIDSELNKLKTENSKNYSITNGLDFLRPCFFKQVIKEQRNTALLS